MLREPAVTSTRRCGRGSLAADNTSVSIEIANARARHLPSTSCESRIVLRQEELNSEPDFTALAFFQKAHSYLFKEWSLFVASDQNKAKSVSSPSIGYSGGSVRARLTTLSSPFIMAEGKITIPPPIGLLETDSYSAKANRVTSATSVTTTFEYTITHADGSGRRAGRGRR